MAVIAGLTRNPWLQIHGCRVKPGMTGVQRKFPLPSVVCDAWRAAGKCDIYKALRSANSLIDSCLRMQAVR